MSQSISRLKGPAIVVVGVMAIAFASLLLALNSELRDGTPTVRTQNPPMAVQRVAAPAVYPSCVFRSTPLHVAEKMLELAVVGPEDVIYDLGSGDGRIVILAAKRFGCQAVGYEIDTELVAMSRAEIKKQELEELATIRSEDVFTLDLSGADVITLYLPSSMLERLLPQLQKLKPGARIVSHEEALPGIEPDQIVQVESLEEGISDHSIFLWKTPLAEMSLASRTP